MAAGGHTARRCVTAQIKQAADGAWRRAEGGFCTKVFVRARWGSELRFECDAKRCKVKSRKTQPKQFEWIWRTPQSARTLGWGPTLQGMPSDWRPREQARHRDRLQNGARAARRGSPPSGARRPDRQHRSTASLTLPDVPAAQPLLPHSYSSLHWTYNCLSQHRSTNPSPVIYTLGYTHTHGSHARRTHQAALHLRKARPAHRRPRPPDPRRPARH